MIKNNNTFFLGIFILLIWLFFGISAWAKEFLTICSAIYLIIISVKIHLPKRGTIKRLKKKEKVTPIFVENSPIDIPSIVVDKKREVEKEDSVIQ
jgi:hypothetical protein